VCTTFALDTTDPAKAFVGTWQSQFQGKPFVTLKLAEQDGKLAGTISRTQVQLNNSGELTSAEPQDGEDTITDAKLSGKVLHFTSKGTDASTQYEMEITAPDQAELRFVGTASSAQAPKPWKLERAVLAARPATMKEKLAAAAQIWMAGQTATTAPTSNAASSGNSATPNTATVAPALKLSDSFVDADLRQALGALPRRVNDQFKNLGDMVNFVIVGSKDEVQNALEGANWHAADTDTRESALKAVLETYQKKDYLTMPMSQLYLFDRVQDFGYEQAEPYAVVASRHHFRIWKAPFTWNNRTVWVGAGTHDIGFERDQRNGKVTHKIDPAVDGERDNIGASLQKTDKVKDMAYYLPADAIREARNATGGGYHSDGRVLVIVLK
jgi:hypothetical protein